MSDEADVEYELLMPFVLVKSRGGVHDDEAFVAGWRLAELGCLLKAAQSHGRPFPTQTLYTSDAAQVDLLAMRYGYNMTATEYDETYSSYDFAAGPDHE